MTRNQKILVDLLLKGCFMRTRTNTNGLKVYVVYNTKYEPLRSFHEKSLKAIHGWLFKTNKKQEISFNLTKVRGLRNNHYIKAKYRSLRSSPARTEISLSYKNLKRPRYKQFSSDHQLTLQL